VQLRQLQQAKQALLAGGSGPAPDGGALQAALRRAPPRLVLLFQVDPLVLAVGGGGGEGGERQERALSPGAAGLAAAAAASARQRPFPAAAGQLARAPASAL
jgi:hypothetical protein